MSHLDRLFIILRSQSVEWTDAEIFVCTVRGKGSSCIYAFNLTTLAKPLQAFPVDFSYLGSYGGLKLQRGQLKIQTICTYPGSTCEIMDFVAGIIS